MFVSSLPLKGCVFYHICYSTSFAVVQWTHPLKYGTSGSVGVTTFTRSARSAPRTTVKFPNVLVNEISWDNFGASESLPHGFRRRQWTRHDRTARRIVTLTLVSVAFHPDLGLRIILLHSEVLKSLSTPSRRTCVVCKRFSPSAIRDEITMGINLPRYKSGRLPGPARHRMRHTSQHLPRNFYVTPEIIQIALRTK